MFADCPIFKKYRVPENARHRACDRYRNQASIFKPNKAGEGGYQVTLSCECADLHTMFIL
jgi:hypothetical protein